MCEHKKEIIALSEKFMIQKCSCGAFHLHYQYLSVTIKKETLFAIMHKCYAWKKQSDKADTCCHKRPFKLVLGLCMITIPNEDFDEFNQVIQEATTKLMNLDDLLAKGIASLN
jgi:hypothetical protein